MHEGRLISSIKRGWRLSPLGKIKHRPRTRLAKWQNIFYLPFDPVWHNAMVLSSYVCIIFHLYYSIEARCITKVKHLEGMFYFLDAIYTLDAILALICKCIPRTKSPDYYMYTRSVCIIFLDVLSTVPCELLFSSNTTKEKKIFCLLRLNRCLRIVRIIYFYRKQLDTINRKMHMLIAELCFLVVFVSLLTYCAFCNTSCFQLGCSSDHICYSSRSFFSVISKLATSGWADFSDVTLSWEIYTSLAVLVVSLFIFGTAFACLTIDTIHSFSHRTIYEDKYRLVSFWVNTSCSERSIQIQNYVREIFDLFGEHRKGYVVNDMSFLKLLPSALCNDILTDMSWSAFKHSQLFRYADLPVLRYISLLMKQEILLPGEYLFRKNEWKDKMFYILSGTIELLSEEDGETPVLLFTQGTCIGESCLIRSYKSINNVRSKSVTEVHSLEKKHFLHVLAKFPNQCKEFRQLIGNRYKEAMEVKHLSDLARGVNKRPVDIYTTFWLKNTLHKLMALAQAQDEELIYRHELQNIYFQSDITEQRLENLVFTAKYLDMLAIKERIAADTDTVFVKTTCPCILQPTSIIRVLWEILILLITIFLLFLIPYVSFVNDEPPVWYNACVYIATYIFWFDIYVQISTAVKADYRIFTKVRKILSFRLKTLSFWADMFSCVPFEIFSCIVLTEVDNKAVMHLNRLLKIWRIGRAFNWWENKFLINVILVSYFKFLLIILYASFLLCCKMYKIKPGSFLEHIAVSVQIITGVGVFDAAYIPDRIELIVADISSRFITLLMYRSIAAATALAYVNKLMVHEVCCDIADKCKLKALSASQAQIMTNQFRFQWFDSKCAILRYPGGVMKAIDNNVKLELRDFMIGDVLRSHNFFKFFSNNVIINMYEHSTSFGFPQNEIMFHQGDFSNSFIVVAQGQVDQLSFNGETFQKRPCKCPIIINLMESCLGLPCLVTSVTATECKVFFMAFDTFANILIKYPDQLKLLKELVGACSDLKQKGLEICGTIDENSVYTSTKIKKPWHYFGFNMKPNSFVEYDYYIPFDRLYPFGFVQYFLGRCMILPDSKLLFAWETFRCVFAIFSCTLCFVIPLVNHVTYKYILYLIDATAFLDIYVRLHICYYDEPGILITHPLKTAGHYFTHGFLIDFIGALPLYLIVSTEDYSLYFTLNLNRFLQLHRLFQMFWFLRTDSMSYVYKIYSIIYIPFLVVLANYCGSFLISTECNFSLENEDFGKEIQCQSDSILFLSDFAKPIGELRAHFFGVYIAISILTNIGIQSFQYTSELTKVFFSVLSVLGLFFSVTAMTIILTIYFSERNTLGSYYQRAMRDLIKFMDNAGVNPILKNAIINNFELKWKHLKGRSIKALTKPFFETLRKDILYGCFGNDLYNSSVFVNKTKRLFGNLLPLMTHDVVSKGGYLQTINDVSGQMVILLKGTADVLAADGIKIATLYNGSIFGNLENVKNSRLLVSIVANCHVEILWIESTKFYIVLRNFPEVKEEFLQFRAKYLSYIPSTTEVELSNKEIRVEETCGHLLVCNPNSKKMRIWISISTFVVYLQMLFELYKIGMLDFSLTLNIIVYVFDILYWISFMVKGFVAYEDDVGNLITDVNLIRKHNRGKKLLWLEIACLVPLDVVIYVFPLSFSLKNYLLCLMRLNRLLRIIFIFQYFSNGFKKLNVNYILLGFQHLVVWISLVIIGMACIINWISCLLPVNMDPHIPSCREFLYMTSHDKFNLFIRYLYIVTGFLTLTSQHIYYPQGTLSVILFMTIMIICHHLYIISLCQIFRILNGASQRIYKYFRMLSHLDLFMQKGYVSPSLFTKVWNYLQMFWIRKKGVIRPKLLYEAPVYLKDAIMNDAFSYLLSNHPIFEKCHPDCLRQIVQQLSSRDYYPGDFIDYKGSVNDSMYFIFTGEVQVLQDEYLFKNNIITVLKAGDSFGVLQGIYGIPQEYSFKSNENSNVLTLSRNTWEYLLDFFPASKESIYNVAAEYNGF